jgi:hypothetical protein
MTLDILKIVTGYGDALGDQIFSNIRSAETLRNEMFARLISTGKYQPE